MVLEFSNVVIIGTLSHVCASYFFRTFIKLHRLQKQAQPELQHRYSRKNQTAQLPRLDIRIHHILSELWISFRYFNEGCDYVVQVDVLNRGWEKRAGEVLEVVIDYCVME